jgi:hypothetical protein
MPVETWRADNELAMEFVRQLPSFGASKKLTDWAEQYARGHAGRCDWDARFLGRHNPGGRYLNIGGSPYSFEFALKRTNPRVEITTVDIDPSRFPGVETALGIRVVEANIEQAGCQLGGQYGCIVFAEVFEHLRVDLLGTLSCIRDALAPDGLFYLTMPNGLGLNAVRQHLLHDRTGPPPVREWEKIRHLGHMGHVREYSLTEAREVLQYCGFVVEREMFRENVTGRWPVRDILLKIWPRLANEVIILARGNKPSLASKPAEGPLANFTRPV